MEVDIACVGFGPATGGFLTTLTQAWNENPADPAFESKAVPGMPLQILCYERADDLAAGVSGVVTLARGIRASFPRLTPPKFPWPPTSPASASSICSTPSAPAGAPLSCVLAIFFFVLAEALCVKDHAFELPWTPAFLNKHGGLVLSIGQFNQWVGSQIMASGLVQIWPGTPVAAPLLSGKAVTGLRLADQGVDKSGAPDRRLHARHGYSRPAHRRRRWPRRRSRPALDQKLRPPARSAATGRVGMKFVIELPEDSHRLAQTRHRLAHLRISRAGDLRLSLRASRPARLGRHLRSLLARRPRRTAYRYLQHYIQHPRCGSYLKDGTLRSWGANRSKNPAAAASPSSPATATPASAKAPAHQHAHRLRRRRSLDHRHPTRRSRPRTAPRRQAFHARKSRRHLRSTTPRKLGRAWRARSRERPQRLPRWHRQRHDRHGLAGLTRGRLSLRQRHSAATPIAR